MYHAAVHVQAVARAAVDVLAAVAAVGAVQAVLAAKAAAGVVM